MNELYNRIQQKAEAKGMKVGTLCKKAGVYKSRLTDLKNGRHNTLSTETIRRLANALGTTPEALLYGENDKRIFHVDMDDENRDVSVSFSSLRDDELLELIAAATMELQLRRDREVE